ncbi:MAG: hypothetical protein R3F59_11170 [Myxococcota bacterium]
MIALALAGCTGGPGGDSGAATGPTARTEAELVDMHAWSRGDPAVWPEPMADHFPSDGDCPEGGAYTEGASFEIRTGTCTHGWFQQPSLVDLVPGDVVEVVFWHGTLVADPPAQGHLAILVGDDLLYDKVVEIPGDPNAYTEQVDVDFAADAGVPVTLHLHNHGANDWNVLRVERQASE